VGAWEERRAGNDKDYAPPGAIGWGGAGERARGPQLSGMRRPLNKL